MNLLSKKIEKSVFSLNSSLCNCLQPAHNDLLRFILSYIYWPNKKWIIIRHWFSCSIILIIHVSILSMEIHPGTSHYHCHIIIAIQGDISQTVIDETNYLPKPHYTRAVYWLQEFSWTTLMANKSREASVRCICEIRQTTADWYIPTPLHRPTGTPAWSHSLRWPVLHTLKHNTFSSPGSWLGLFVCCRAGYQNR